MKNRYAIAWLALFNVTLSGCVHTDLLNTGGLTLRLGADKEFGATEAVAMAGGFDDMQSTFTTSTFTVLSAEGGKHNYTAYVSCDAEHPGSNAQGTINATEPTLHLGSGWAYVYGSHAIVQTRRVRAIGGPGTRFIVEIAADCDRIYLIPATGEHAVAIECRLTDPPAVHELSMQGQYMQVRDDCSASESRDIVGSPHHGFVVRAREAAIQQNLEWYRQNPWP